jgi:hypothetical protein
VPLAEVAWVEKLMRGHEVVVVVVVVVVVEEEEVVVVVVVVEDKAGWWHLSSLSFEGREKKVSRVPGRL